MKNNLRTHIAIALSVALMLSLSACNSQSDSTDVANYPSEDVTIIIPFAAGGITDLLGRVIANEMSNEMGVNVVVQNVEGGGGTTGVSQAVNSDPDGYTIALASNGGYLINPEITDVGYTWETTTPIAIVSEPITAIAVSADSPFDTLEELMEYAKANPGEITYTTPGANSAPHLFFAEIGMTNDIQWNHSPNSSSPAALAELIGGHIDVFVINAPTLSSSYEVGDVKVLAVTSEERDPGFPDVPTIYELGIGMPATTYFGFVGPADMNPEIVTYLSDLIGNVLENPEVEASMSDLNYPINYVNAEDFAERCPIDSAMYKEVLAGIYGSE